MKQCYKCGEWKSCLAFYKDMSQLDGRTAACKECQKAYQKQKYWEQPEYHRGRKRTHYRNNLESERLRGRLKAKKYRE